MLLQLKDQHDIAGSRGKNLATRARISKEFEDMLKGLGVIALIAIIIVLIIVGPLLTIWALNTLFPLLAIPYTFWTWLSVVILGGVFKSNVTVKKN